MQKKLFWVGCMIWVFSACAPESEIAARKRKSNKLNGTETSTSTSTKPDAGQDDSHLSGKFTDEETTTNTKPTEVSSSKPSLFGVQATSGSWGWVEQTTTPRVRSEDYQLTTGPSLFLSDLP